MFSLLSQTDDDLNADIDRAAAAAARQKMLDRQAAPIIGRPVDTQGALFAADATLFTGPSAADILAGF